MRRSEPEDRGQWSVFSRYKHSFSGPLIQKGLQGPSRSGRSWLGIPNVSTAESNKHSMGSGSEILLMFTIEIYKRRNTNSE